tara:strand:+ start:22 stop:387 length:366 start_codon:yes stop_codon:yes gene_type:complete
MYIVLHFKKGNQMTKRKWTVGRPPRKNGRPIGAKWDKAVLYWVNYLSGKPFDQMIGFPGNMNIWVIVGHKWVTVSATQNHKICTPAKAKIKKSRWEDIVKSLSSSDYIRRHGGDIGIREVV